MDKFVVVITETPKKEYRFITTGDIGDRQKIAAQLVILKLRGEIHDWGVFPVESIALGELKKRLGIPR